MKPSDPDFEAWLASHLTQELDRLRVTTPERQGQIQWQFPFRRNSMSLMPLLAAIKSQGVVIAATLVVGVCAIGMATTGSPNPTVWGSRLAGSIQAGGNGGSAPTITTATPEPTPSPDETNASGTPLRIALTPEPTDTPEAVASPEPKESPEAVVSPEPKETPEPAVNPEPKDSEGSGDD